MIVRWNSDNAVSCSLSDLSFFLDRHVIYFLNIDMLLNGEDFCHGYPTFYSSNQTGVHRYVLNKDVFIDTELHRKDKNSRSSYICR